MKNHSMIFDEFFADPKRAKALINRQEIQDIKYSDGVVYPNIALLPDSVLEEAVSNIESICGPVKVAVSFARYSFTETKPPHWAHSDGDIAQFLALIYLNENRDDAGTVCLRHIELGMEAHPTSDFQKNILLGHANKRDEWEVVFECPARWNRLFILNAGLIHASQGQYGETKEDGRLVVSIFFDLDSQ